MTKLPGWPSDSLAVSTPVVTKVLSETWYFPRSDFVGFGSLVLEGLRGLEAAVEEHFAGAQRHRYPRLFPLRRQVGRACSSYTKLRLHLQHLQGWHS